MPPLRAASPGRRPNGQVGPAAWQLAKFHVRGAACWPHTADFDLGGLPTVRRQPRCLFIALSPAIAAFNAYRFVLRCTAAMIYQNCRGLIRGFAPALRPTNMGTEIGKLIQRPERIVVRLYGSTATSSTRRTSATDGRKRTPVHQYQRHAEILHVFLSNVSES